MTRAVTGLVFNIQKYSIQDGPGIRTTVFLKGCPLRCQWCHNPESQSTEAELSIAEDRCAQSYPPLEAVHEDGHLSACFRKNGPSGSALSTRTNLRRSMPTATFSSGRRSTKRSGLYFWKPSPPACR